MEIKIKCPYCEKINHDTLEPDEIEHAHKTKIFVCDNTTCQKEFVVRFEITATPHVHKIE